MATLVNYDTTLRSTREKIARSPLSEDNKAMIRGFEQYLLAEGLSDPRRNKLINHVYLIGMRYLPGDFRTATRDQIWDAILQIESSSSLAAWSKHDYKVAAKKFWKYAAWGLEGLRREGYPETVAGIRLKLRKRDRYTVQANDILSVDETWRFIGSTGSTQERAFALLIYELGARVSEIGTLTIGDVSRVQYGFMCDVDGKTGPRSSQAVLSSGALGAWINVHPCRDDPSERLWGYYVGTNWKHLSYSKALSMVHVLKARSEIAKRVHPHLFRHTRITHLLRSGQWNEAQIKKYFGFSADSDVLAVYSHLINQDANDAVLRMNGLKTQQEPLPMPLVCGNCSEFNEPIVRFCHRCQAALTSDAVTSTQRVESAQTMVAELMQRPEVAQAIRAAVSAQLEQELQARLATDQFLRPAEFVTSRSPSLVEQQDPRTQAPSLRLPAPQERSGLTFVASSQRLPLPTQKQVREATARAHSSEEREY